MPVPLPQVPKGTSGSYGSFRSAIPNAKTTGASAAYAKAVQTVFAHQGNAQKGAILAGAQANPNLPSSKIVLAAAKAEVMQKLSGGLGKSLGITHAASVVGHTIASVPKAVTGAIKSDFPTSFNDPVTGKAYGDPVAKVIQNTAKDAVNLPANLAASVAIPAQDVLKGDWKAAANTFVQPYEQLFKNPLQSFGNHPLDTYLMASGLEHPVTRLGEGIARTVAGKGAVDLSRPSVELTGNLTHERPDYATTPRYRGGQKALEAVKFSKTDKGTLTPNSENVRARLVKMETSRLVGENERIRRSNHTDQMEAHAKSVLVSRVGRVAHAVKTTLAYDPKAPLIPGSDVLSLIARGVVRRPGTVARDLETHLQQVASTRPDLLDKPDLLATHDKYVKTVQKALGNEKFLKNPHPAFKAAAKYAEDYPKIEHAANALDHFNGMTSDALQRRVLMSGILTHMKGARYDPELGMVRDDPRTGVTEKLSTDKMRSYMSAETGARKLAFVSDQSPKGDSAHYVSGQQRPRNAAMGNTNYAFTHGLTDPSHEAMLSQRVRMQGVVDAHRAMNRLDHHLLVMGDDGKGYGSYKEAATASHATGGKLVPIRRASPFHPIDSLAKSTKGLDMASLDEETARRSLDISDRLKPSDEPGTWGLIDKNAAAQLKAHQDQISPNTFLRAAKGVNNQFRTVALATSFKHLPGVAQESLIRSASSGVGPFSWFAGRQALKGAEKLDETVGHERRVQMTGGTVVGQAQALATRQVARHFEGTALHGPLKAWENAQKAPGLRQASTLWRAWTKFSLGGTKKMLEEQSQIAGLGKATINEFGGRHGLVSLAMGQWGHMIDQASKGILDEQTAHKLGATVERIYGRWNDLTPGAQQALMFSPFGMWWTNSVKWLYRMPVDHPVLSGTLGAANVGTQGARQKLGLDMFAPGALPLYEQGSVPIGNSLWEASYYSPMGVATDPLETAESLIQPWALPGAMAALGVDWKGSSITSPKNPTGYNTPNMGDRLTVILNSAAANFIPLYQKAQTVVEGGGSAYDTSTLLKPQTKATNPGPLKGLVKAVMPVRLGKTAASSGAAPPPPPPPPPAAPPPPPPPAG
jgi:hypothetical protein